MSSSDNSVISAHGVSKKFRLAAEKTASIKSGILGLFRGGASKGSQDQYALREINFEVKEGEFFGIVGRNGSGKSTLLKMLAGIYQPTKGSITVKGKLVPFIELGVGFNPELTGRENVYLNGAILGFSQKEVEDMYDSIVDFAELEQFMDQKLKNYSSGMQVRLAFSMAIRANADILLIDEVLAVGDADFQRKCFKYFNQLKEEKKTVIFISHDMDAVREYCTRAILINDSRLIGEGSADEIAEAYLRLMTPDSTAVSEAEGESHWGDGTCLIENVACKVDDNTILLSHRVIVKRDCRDFVYGYRIRNSMGEELCGTNDMILGHKPKASKENDIINVEWKIDNALGDGTYFVDVAVIYDSTHTVADWWDRAVTIEIVRERRTHYPLHPKTSITINKES